MPIRPLKEDEEIIPISPRGKNAPAVSDLPAGEAPLLPESLEFPITNFLVNLFSKPEVYRNTAETTGLVGGALAGAPILPPFGSIIGAGLGFAGARQGVNIGEELLGLRETPPLAEQLP